MTRRLLCAAVVILSLCGPVAGRECAFVTFAQAAKVYPFVLLGRAVTSKNEIVRGNRGMYSVIEFEVRQVWKGTTTKRIRLYQTLSAEHMHFEKTLGVDFVIFARPLTDKELAFYSGPPNTDALTADYCASKPAAGQDLTSLGQSRPPAVGLF
jgi:hypothetical protein